MRDNKMVVTLFGQIVIGPPGSGKSTYCKYIHENLKRLGRNAKIINLDPANECLPYKASIDLKDLINVDMVMDKGKLGPNGAMIYCIETLNKNFGWLYDNIVTLMESETKQSESMTEQRKQDSSIANLNEKNPYFIIDCPGQSELYTHLTAMREIIKKLTTKNPHFDLRLVCLNLCDAYHASDLGKYIGIVMNSLSTMLNLELPHLNILSKVDKIESYGKTRFNLDFYCEVLNMKYLLDSELDSPFYEKYRNLSQAMISVIDDYGLVSFVPLNIQQAEDIIRVLQLADKANGYYANDQDLSILQTNPRLLEMASGMKQEPIEDTTT